MYIGIITRLNNDRYTLNKEICDVIKKAGYEPIGILASNVKKLEEVILLCKGFILQGGDNYNTYDLEIVKYLYEHDIPTLGICLGMQMMGKILKGKLYKVKNHLSQDLYVHDINIKENTKLYEILNKKTIKVNSRHKEALKGIEASAISNDNVIEAIEDKNKKFFIGLEWHPESIMDSNSKKIFEAFFKNLDRR